MSFLDFVLNIFYISLTGVITFLTLRLISMINSKARTESRQDSHQSHTIEAGDSNDNEAGSHLPTTSVECSSSTQTATTSLKEKDIEDDREESDKRISSNVAKMCNEVVNDVADVDGRAHSSTAVFLPARIFGYFSGTQSANTILKEKNIENDSEESDKRISSDVVKICNEVVNDVAHFDGRAHSSTSFFSPARFVEYLSSTRTGNTSLKERNIENDSEESGKRISSDVAKICNEVVNDVADVDGRAHSSTAVFFPERYPEYPSSNQAINTSLKEKNIENDTEESGKRDFSEILKMIDDSWNDAAYIDNRAHPSATIETSGLEIKDKDDAMSVSEENSFYEGNFNSRVGEATASTSRGFLSSDDVSEKSEKLPLVLTLRKRKFPHSMK